MGVTVDLIPRFAGESPEQAIERIYEGGVAVSWDAETETMTIADIDGADGATRVPAAMLDEWRTETLARLGALHPWQREDFDGSPHLWSANYLWQVEFETDHITLRARRPCAQDPSIPELDDSTFLAAFEGLAMIIHWPDMYGTWCDLDDPADRPDVIG